MTLRGGCAATRLLPTRATYDLAKRLIRIYLVIVIFFFSSRRRHTRFDCDWSSDVCSSDLAEVDAAAGDEDRADALRACPAEAAVDGARAGRDGHASAAAGRHHRGRHAVGEIGRASCRERV